jgi:hypothetical protein
VVVVLAGVAAIGLVTASRSLVPEPPRRMGLPTASELVELERYLTPVAVGEVARVGTPPRVEIDGNPFRGPAPAPREEQPQEAAPLPWRVTAIMIAGDRRVAVVNDRLVRPGDRLEDGARVESVGRDYVVLITPDGQRRRLELEG